MRLRRKMDTLTRLSLISLCLFSMFYGSLQWADCGIGRGSLIHFSHVNIDSVKGNITFSFNGMMETGVPGPPKLNVTIEKSLRGPWTVVPCINKIGSCVYDSPCELVKALFNKKSCPVAYRGKGCSGLSLYDPIPYYFDPISYNIATAAQGVRGFLVGSALRVQIEMIQEINNHPTMIGCVSFFTTIDLPCTGFLCG